MNRLIVLCLCVGVVGPVWADPPVAQYVFPAGGQRGTTVKFHVGGLYLNKSCTMEMLGTGVEASPTITRTTSPWFEGSILPLPESQRQEDYPRTMVASVKIAADAQGDRLVLMRTPQGITLPLPFVIGPYPEIVEEEKEGEAVPVHVTAPTTVNGRIFPREDLDRWAVMLKKGQTLSCLVDADRLGSPLKAKLDVLDPNGQRMAEVLPKADGDPRLHFTATHDGLYQVSITDVRSEGGAAYVYRLTLTTDEVIDHVYPLGGRRGQRVDVEAFGSRGTTHQTITVPPTGRLSLSHPFDLDTLPEIRERDRDNTLQVPCVANGRISKAGESDRWQFSAQKGEVLELELRAARLGSPLLGVVAITDAMGKELAKAEPNNTLDSSLRFTAPSDGTYTVTVHERFRQRGGAAYAYRLRVTHPEQGFDLRFALPSLQLPQGANTPPLPTLTINRGAKVSIRLTAKRHGTFNGPIAITVEGLPNGVTVPNNIVLQANQQSMDIPLTAETNVKLSQAIVRLRGTALVPFVPFTALPLVVSKTATWSDDSPTDELRLAVAIPTPFKIVGDYELKLIPRGTVHTRKYRIERNGYTGPIEIDLADRQARHLQGVTGPVLQIPDEKSEFEYPITLPPWMETGRTCRVCVMGTATIRDIDGKDYVVSYSSREQNDQIIAVVEPERLGLIVDQQTVRAEAGKTISLPVRVRRGQKLEGEATINVHATTELKGVVIPAVVIDAKSEHGKLMFTFAAGQSLSSRVLLTIRATVLDHGRPVTAEKQLELLPAR